MLKESLPQSFATQKTAPSSEGAKSLPQRGRGTALAVDEENKTRYSAAERDTICKRKILCTV